MKFNFRKTGTIACALLPMSFATKLVAQELEHADPTIEEMIVTSTLHRSRADTAMPVSILSGEELRERVAATLGEMLADQVGVSVASFGAGVGSPVIRGQGGNRVQILQGGIGNIDASAISADHANSLLEAGAEPIRYWFQRGAHWWLFTAELLRGLPHTVRQFGNVVVLQGEQSSGRRDSSSHFIVEGLGASAGKVYRGWITT